MKRRSRHRARQAVAVNYWPGYVDALTNVVLNLLFLIAMFGISLSVLNAGSRRADGRGRDQASGSPTGERRVTGPLAPIIPGTSDSEGGPVRVLTPAGTTLALPPGLPGLATGPLAGAPDRRVPGPGGPLNAPLPIAPEGQPRAPGIGVPPGREAPDAPAVVARAPSRSADGPGRLGGGYAPPGLPGGALSFTVVDAYQRRFMPGVQVSRSPQRGGGVLLTIRLAIGTEPVAALQQPGFRSLLASGLGNGAGLAPGAGRITVWTATRLADPQLRRTGYLALIEARNQLIALGYPPAAVETRLVEGSAATSDAKLIFIHATPADAG